VSSPGAIAALAAAMAAASAVAALREGVRGWPLARDWFERAVSPLARAGSEAYEPTERERRRLWLAGSLLSGAVLLAVFGVGIYLAVLGAVPIVSDRLLAARRRRFHAAFEAGLGPWARSLGDAIGAGQSVRAAVIVSAPGCPAPVSGEVARVRADLETGAALEDALARLSERIGLPALDSVIGALGVAARSGGDVARLLHRFATANDERVALLADSRSATAQARMTGVAVAAMPAAGLAFAELSSPGFTTVMAGDEVAGSLLLVSAAVQVLAFAAIRRISRIQS